jgi:hypothetical protein
MKGLITIAAILLSTLTYGQANNDTIQVIAELITPGYGSKIYVAKYRVIKVIKGNVANDTIDVGYYFYKEPQHMPDTALLNLTTYTVDTTIRDYYIFPDYDAKNGIEKVNLAFIKYDSWEPCETGKGECNPVTITRNSTNEKWYVIMPCGGTSTTVTLSAQQGIPEGDELIQKEKISHSECPPIFELTNLRDGKYFAYMISCRLGGQIEINITTEKE